MTATTYSRDMDVAPARQFDASIRTRNGVQCLCPFCGAFHSEIGRPCSSCALEDNTATRAATERRRGDWFVLHPANPSAPGVNLDALRTLVRNGVVTARSVVRGPSTGQLWRLASRVRGISRELGLCYSCGKDVDPAAARCSHCERSQTLPDGTDPAPRARPIPKDDLLTARDVAKAFQLDFAATELDTLLPHVPAPGKKLKIAVAAGAILAVGGLLWPLGGAVSGRPSQAAGPVAAVEPASVVAAPEPRFVASESPVAAPRPVELPAPPAVTARPAAAVITAAAEVARADRVTPPPAPVDVDPVDADAADVRTLFSAGLDAESRGNYRGAVAAYEKIAAYPGSQWPPTLKTRLALARRGAKGDL